MNVEYLGIFMYIIILLYVIFVFYMNRLDGHLTLATIEHSDKKTSYTRNET